MYIYAFQRSINPCLSQAYLLLLRMGYILFFIEAQLGSCLLQFDRVQDLYLQAMDKVTVCEPPSHMEEDGTINCYSLYFVQLM